MCDIFLSEFLYFKIQKQRTDKYWKLNSFHKLVVHVVDCIARPSPHLCVFRVEVAEGCLSEVLFDLIDRLVNLVANHLLVTFGFGRLGRDIVRVVVVFYLNDVSAMTVAEELGEL